MAEEGPYTVFEDPLPRISLYCSDESEDTLGPTRQEKS